MSFIVTADGFELDMDYPNVDAISHFGIAWSLSQINRFNGHAVRPYSVAEHSLLVAEIIERDFGLDAHAQFAALMHDAHEAYAGDMHTPGKGAIGAAWYAWENRWERLVRSVFGFHTPAAAFASSIHRADLMALATEKRDLLPHATAQWPVLVGVEPVGWMRLNVPERAAMSWEDWRDRFDDQFHALDFARSEIPLPSPATEGTTRSPLEQA